MPYCLACFGSNLVLMMLVMWVHTAPDVDHDVILTMWMLMLMITVLTCKLHTFPC